MSVPRRNTNSNLYGAKRAKSMSEIEAESFGCVVEIHPMGGEMWRVVNIDAIFSPPMERIANMVDAFIAAHPHEGFTLSIYDTVAEQAHELLDVPVSEMGERVSEIFHVEKAMPVAFVGENLLSDSYVVGMPLTRGRYFISDMGASVGGSLPSCSVHGIPRIDVSCAVCSSRG